MWKQYKIFINRDAFLRCSNGTLIEFVLQQRHCTIHLQKHQRDT